MTDLVNGVLSGKRRELARLISLIENEDGDAIEALIQLYKHTGKAHVIGVTGPPGSGKSSLVTKLTAEFRKRKNSIGIVCVDPSSPFTGGALLGDRIRMQEHSLDKEVYVRSMGTRGHLGGLARATSDAVRAIDAFGKDIIFVETVGAGQSEVEVIDVAQTVIVTDMPGSGDDIQAIKAGIMEIADIFVVNKMDLPGAERKVTEINAMLDIDPSEKDWRPPVLLTNSRSGEGVTELADKILEQLTRELYQKLEGQPEYEAAIKKIATRKEDPYSVAERLIAEFLFSESR
ncbi:MAG: methylmalonyl Co-A mutase-associated GTPase MeaB [Candidatus Thorarchaeota archaeon]